MEISITPDEAWLIDLIFHYPEFSTHSVQKFEDILLKVGRSIVANRTEDIDLSEDDLWLIKVHMHPNVKVGKTTGQDLLEKVYRALLMIHKVPIPVEGNVKLPAEVPENTKLIKVINDNEDRTENKTSNCTVCGSGYEIEL